MEKYKNKFFNEISRLAKIENEKNGTQILFLAKTEEDACTIFCGRPIDMGSLMAISASENQGLKNTMIHAHRAYTAFLEMKLEQLLKNNSDNGTTD